MIESQKNSQEKSMEPNDEQKQISHSKLKEISDTKLQSSNHDSGQNLQKILITGGLGFIGSHLAIALNNSHNRILVVDNLSRPTPNLQKKWQDNSYNQNYLGTHYPEIQQAILDIRKKDQLMELMHKFHPNIIIHAAGQTSAVFSVKEPYIDFDENMNASLILFQTIKEVGGVDLVLFISSNKVYGELHEKIPLIEEEMRYRLSQPKIEAISEDYYTLNQVRTPYGTAKFCIEQYLQEYSHLAQFDYVILRLSCIYGPRQFGFSEQGWITHFLIQSILNQPVTIFGNGKQVRDILFIDDLTDAIACLIKKRMGKKPLLETSNPQAQPHVFNLGGGEISNISLLELLQIMYDEGLYPSNIQITDWRPADQRYYVSNIQKICRYLEWQPNTVPIHGIKATYRWLFDHKEIFMG